MSENLKEKILRRDAEGVDILSLRTVARAGQIALPGIDEAAGEIDGGSIKITELERKTFENKEKTMTEKRYSGGTFL